MSRTGVAVAALALAIFSPSADADDHEFTATATYRNRTSLDPELCTAEDGIVGRRACPGYGMWGTALESPYATISFGMNIRRLARMPTARPSSARSTQPSSTTASAGYDSSYTLMEQVAISMTRHTYAGFEVEISPTDDAIAPGSRNFAAGTQLLVGLAGSSTTLKLGVELAGGGRLIVTERSSADDSEYVLETRARGDLWLTPWITVGVAIGASLIDRGEWMTGIYLAAHTHAFGGP